ncbi:MAG: signal recognition particle protein [Oscillospiraceae bacterium]|nr:signal recognition particle protein [Oscillospiraceae bacterium]
MFSNLSNKISDAFKRLKSKGKLSEKDVKEAMREVRLALLEADVNYKVAKDFTDRLVERSIGNEVLESLTASQTIVKIVNEELTNLMGTEQVRINTSSKPPTVIMLCGLQGSGKTTHAVKLALSQKKRHHRPLLVACDVYRPAAIDQLEILSSKIDVPIFQMGNINPVEIARQAVIYAKDHGNDVVILDTAGRLQVDKELMQELSNIKSKISPSEILLVVDAMTGQNAVDIASSFNDLLNITGVVLTKLDGDTRGGAALSIRQVTGKPIKFIGVGEKLEDLEEFHPDRMASRILGMGDVLTLIEEVESRIDHSQLKKMAKDMMSNKLNLNDLLHQFKQIRKIGPVKSIISKLPGVQKQIQDMDFDERHIDRMQAIILSMTDKERIDPKILNFSRKKRVARGSGVGVEDVNKLLKAFDHMQKMTKMFKKSGKAKKNPFNFGSSALGNFGYKM